jgi:hypothetical protein
LKLKKKKRIELPLVYTVFASTAQHALLGHCNQFSAYQLALSNVDFQHSFGAIQLPKQHTVYTNEKK